jgi:Mlc titration factor MtfA (ptsG expression regulator)
MLPVPPLPEPNDAQSAGFTRPTRGTSGSHALPEDWLTFLEANVFHYRLLKERERKRLQADARTLIARKDWEGCRGLTVTDEMKVTIAGQACLMLLGQEHDGFGGVRTILIYPSAFKIVNEEAQEAGWLPMPAGGQSVPRGPVILSWDAVLSEGRDPSQGANLVIHEFAHQLDFADGYGEGTLDLPGEDGDRWQQVLDDEYRWLCREIRRGHDTFLGDYAATSKSELFATASERFFTLPVQLRHYHPALYEMLKVAYAVNPAKWFARLKQQPPDK